MIKELNLTKDMAVAAMNRLEKACEAPDQASAADAVIFEAWFGPLVDRLAAARKTAKAKAEETKISEVKAALGLDAGDEVIFVGAHGDRAALGVKQTTHLEKGGLVSLFERDPAAVPSAAKTEALLPAAALKKLAAAGIIDKSLVYEVKKDGVKLVFKKEAKK